MAYRYENELDVEMSWHVEKAEPKEIAISLDFSDKSSVSINPHDPDKVELQLLKKDLFLGASSQKVAVHQNTKQASGFLTRVKGDQNPFE